VSVVQEARVGIFWVIETRAGPTLLTASCPLAEAEPYGDCLTFGSGHYQVWRNWRSSRELEAAARAVVREYEYEEWPRGRVVFGRATQRFVLYTDRKLMDAENIERIRECFQLPFDRVSVEGDSHYRSTEVILGHPRG